MSAAPNLYKPEGGWVKHSTRVRPVAADTIVEPWFGFGRARNTYEAGKLNWAGFNTETAIRGYRVVSEGEAA